MAKKRKPQPQQSGNDPTQMILGIAIGTVFGAIITSGIFLISGSGGGSTASQTVALNAGAEQSDGSAAQAVPIPDVGAGKAKASSAKGASEDSSGMSSEMEMQMQMAANEGGGAGSPAAPAGESEMSEEMAMQMEMAANAGGASGNPATSAPGGASSEMSAEMAMQMAANNGAAGAPAAPGGSSVMSEEMAMQMAANGGAGSSAPGANNPAISISPEMANMSLGGAGEPGMSGPGMSGPGMSGPGMSGPGGGEGGGITGKADPLFMAELDRMEIPEADMNSAELQKFVQPSIVKIITQGTDGAGAANGFVVSQSGLVITSYHVIEGVKQATVEFTDGTKSNVTGYKLIDPKYDIAVLQVQPSGKKLKPLYLANELPEKKSPLFAFTVSRGSAASAKAKQKNPFLNGVKSFLGPNDSQLLLVQGTVSEIYTPKEMRGRTGGTLKGTWLHTSVPVSSQTNTVALFNMRGQVVAMNTLRLVTGQDVNLAISSPDLLAIAKAGSGKKVTPFDPKNMPAVSPQLKRLMAKDIQGTDKSNELLSKINELSVQLVYDQARLDPNSVLKNGIFAYAKRNIGKMDIPVSEGEPKNNIPVLIVTITTKGTRKTDPDRQTVLANAYLIIKDPEAKSKNEFVNVWSTSNYELGTVSINALSQGFIPKTFAPKVSSFFNKFKSAHSKANRTVKTKKG